MPADTETINEKVRVQAKDLRKEFPRSPRDTAIGGYVLAARALDKCRATLSGTNGEYNFNCGLDKGWFEFAGIDAEAFRAFVATGATDEEVSAWVTAHAKQRGEAEPIVLWNNQRRGQRLMDLSPRLQVYMEEYARKCLAHCKPVNFYFDIYDLEEHRL